MRVLFQKNYMHIFTKALRMRYCQRLALSRLLTLLIIKLPYLTFLIFYCVFFVNVTIHDGRSMFLYQYAVIEILPPLFNLLKYQYELRTKVSYYCQFLMHSHTFLLRLCSFPCCYLFGITMI